MTWKKHLPLAVGVVLAVLAAGLIGGAMFAADKGEELVHLYKDLYPTKKQPSVRDGMELRGQWRGMTVAAVGSRSARSLGLRDEVGVAVVALSKHDRRARQAGLSVGDVVTTVDQQRVRDMTDLYSASRRSDAMKPVLVGLRRQRQQMTLVLPAAAAPGVERELERWGGVPAAWPRRYYYCPMHGATAPSSAAPGSGQPFTCPRCRQPLRALQPPGR